PAQPREQYHHLRFRAVLRLSGRPWRLSRQRVRLWKCRVHRLLEGTAAKNRLSLQWQHRCLEGARSYRPILHRPKRNSARWDDFLRQQTTRNWTGGGIFPTVLRARRGLLVGTGRSVSSLMVNENHFSGTIA